MLLFYIFCLALELYIEAKNINEPYNDCIATISQGYNLGTVSSKP